jgi:hypothetical protein
MENKLPLGILFDEYTYFNMEELDKFIENMNRDQAIYCIIQAVQAAYKRNTYTLAESEAISKAIRRLSLPNPTES